MRDFAAEKNAIDIADGRSGDIHEMYYRNPTAKEMAVYQAAMFERKGKKVVNKVYSTRIKFGEAILTGFKPGTFGINGVAISAVETDPGYRADWKKLLVDNSPDVVAAVAQQVFEGTGVNKGTDDIEFVTEGDDTSPLSAA